MNDQGVREERKPEAPGRLALNSQLLGAIGGVGTATFLVFHFLVGFESGLALLVAAAAGYMAFGGVLSHYDGEWVPGEWGEEWHPIRRDSADYD